MVSLTSLSSPLLFSDISEAMFTLPETSSSTRSVIDFNVIFLGSGLISLGISDFTFVSTNAAWGYGPYDMQIITLAHGVVLKIDGDLLFHH